MQMALRTIGRDVKSTDWELRPYSPNGQLTTRNEVFIPVRVLQPPFFNLAADDAVNYGGIGTIIGHELTHAFDNFGRKIDAQGNQKNWWTPQDEKRFQETVQKFVQQFDHYVIDGTRISGQTTANENIADLGGLELAYAALQEALLRNPKAGLRIDGFTPQQRFFIAYAQISKMNSNNSPVFLGLSHRYSEKSLRVNPSPK
jgi:putative endopeptidase